MQNDHRALSSSRITALRAPTAPQHLNLHTMQRPIQRPLRSSAIERARSKKAAAKAAMGNAADDDSDSGGDVVDSEGGDSPVVSGTVVSAARSHKDAAASTEHLDADGAALKKPPTFRERMGYGGISGQCGVQPPIVPSDRLYGRDRKPSLEVLSTAAHAGGAKLRAVVTATMFAKKPWRKTGSMDQEELPAFDRTKLFDEEEALVQLEGHHTSITIHRTDELPHDWRIAHPMIQLSIINGYTGHLLRKSVVERPATTQHEVGPGGGVLPFLLPILTKPFGLRGSMTRMPNWEEELLVAEDFAYLLHPRVFFLLELLDFDPESREAPPCSWRGDYLADRPHPAGMRPFAWGFLKPISGSMGQPGHANLLRPMPLRLQLYRWQTTARPQANQPAVWAQYLAAGRQAYSSTVFMTIRPQKAPEALPVKFPHRPTAAHHAEEGRLSYERMQEDTARGSGNAAANAADLRPATASCLTSSLRLPGLTNLPKRNGGACFIPNAPLHTLPAGANGATAISISPDGVLLAIALEERSHVMLAVHDLSSGRRRALIHAHHRTVHELCWSAEGDTLVSVSADGTAKLWRPQADGSAEPPEAAFATLTHPSFVYCARMQPKGPIGRGAPLPGGAATPRFVLTGCNDCTLRLWDAENEVLLSAKKQHKARINCVAWPSESLIFSADSSGVVKQWELIGRDPTELKMVSSIEKRELEGVPLNSITLHPNRRRLLLQTRKNQLLALDTRLQHFSARYIGNTCTEYHIRASYSPDGRYVIAGSEDGNWYLWAEESGELLLDGQPAGFSGPLLQAAWSPAHHVLALCGYGAHNPVRVYTFAVGKPALDPKIDRQLPSPFGLTADAAASVVGGGAGGGGRGGRNGGSGGEAGIGGAVISGVSAGSCAGGGGGGGGGSCAGAGCGGGVDASALSAQRSARRGTRQVVSMGFDEAKRLGEDLTLRRKAAAADARAGNAASE